MDYKEKLRLATEALDSGSYDKETIEYIFPELKEESEDERIRKALIDYHKRGLKDSPWFTQELKHQEVLAWLEKQGKNNMGISEATKRKLEDNLNKALEKETPESWNEFLDKQKPIIVPKFKVGDKVVHKGTGKLWTVHWYIKEDNVYSVEDSEGLINIYSPDMLELIEQKPAWSEEDDTFFKAIIRDIENIQYISEDAKKDRISWLKSLKDRVQPKPRQEWSENDERIRKISIGLLEVLGYQGYATRESVDWLKSLRRQNTWKPSDEQIDALEDAIADSVSSIHKNMLNSLYSDLKKLREE